MGISVPVAPVQWETYKGLILDLVHVQYSLITWKFLSQKKKCGELYRKTVALSSGLYEYTDKHFHMHMSVHHTCEFIYMDMCTHGHVHTHAHTHVHRHTIKS